MELRNSFAYRLLLYYELKILSFIVLKSQTGWVFFSLRNRKKKLYKLLLLIYFLIETLLRVVCMDQSSLKHLM